MSDPAESAISRYAEEATSSARVHLPEAVSLYADFGEIRGRFIDIYTASIITGKSDAPPDTSAIRAATKAQGQAVWNVFSNAVTPEYPVNAEDEKPRYGHSLSAFNKTAETVTTTANTRGESQLPPELKVLINATLAAKTAGVQGALTTYMSKNDAKVPPKVRDIIEKRGLGDVITTLVLTSAAFTLSSVGWGNIAESLAMQASQHSEYSRELLNWLIQDPNLLRTVAGALGMAMGAGVIYLQQNLLTETYRQRTNVFRAAGKHLIQGITLGVSLLATIALSNFGLPASIHGQRVSNIKGVEAIADQAETGKAGIAQLLESLGAEARRLPVDIAQFLQAEANRPINGKPPEGEAGKGPAYWAKTALSDGIPSASNKIRTVKDPKGLAIQFERVFAEYKQAYQAEAPYLQAGAGKSLQMIKNDFESGENGVPDLLIRLETVLRAMQADPAHASAIKLDDQRKQVIAIFEQLGTKLKGLQSDVNFLYNGETINGQKIDGVFATLLQELSRISDDGYGTKASFTPNVNIKVPDISKIQEALGASNFPNIQSLGPIKRIEKAFELDPQAAPWLILVGTLLVMVETSFLVYKGVSSSKTLKKLPDRDAQQESLNSRIKEFALPFVKFLQSPAFASAYPEIAVPSEELIIQALVNIVEGKDIQAVPEQLLNEHSIINRMKRRIASFMTRRVASDIRDPETRRRSRWEKTLEGMLENGNITEESALAVWHQLFPQETTGGVGEFYEGAENQQSQLRHEKRKHEIARDEMSRSDLEKMHTDFSGRINTLQSASIAFREKCINTHVDQKDLVIHNKNHPLSPDNLERFLADVTKNATQWQKMLQPIIQDRRITGVEAMEITDKIEPLLKKFEEKLQSLENALANIS